jgi:geranylgeranyl pyrophosphate synthase
MDKTAEKIAAVHAVPPTLAERTRLRGIIADMLREESFTPPLSMGELSDIALRLIRSSGADRSLKGWLMVEINNGAWKSVVAAVPCSKRILLLPQCLRHASLCRADMDELGLLCRGCGSCSISGLQDIAEELGMITLVAEGFTPVMGLLESGAADTVIGVGCLDSLEKAFPLLIRHAVPGIAVPLNRGGCRDTHVDCDYVESWMRMAAPPSQASPSLLVHDEIKATVREWFLPDKLAEVMGEAADPASRVAREWLSGDGKRWRPYLSVSVFLALTGRREIPETLRRAAVAVECFHKASLVHDDIQDSDLFRNHRHTVHAVQGVPIAINAGDLLLGEGYRLLASCNRVELVQTAADAHLALCKGQGMELEWSRSPKDITPDYVLEIFSSKTVPAFEVALDFGLICSGITDPATKDILHSYSKALGIAYQLLDDVNDFEEETPPPPTLRPSAILAILCEQNPANRRIRRLRKAEDLKDFLTDTENKPLLQKACEQATSLAGAYRRQAIASLAPLHNMELKRLLFRLTEHILK